MDEADALADRVGIMDHGTLLALDTPTALTRSLPGSTTLDVTLVPPDGVPPDELINALAGLTDVERVEPVKEATGAPGEDLRLRLYVSGEAPPLVAPVATLLREHAATLSDVTIGDAEPRGRLHPLHRKGAPMSGPVTTATTPQTRPVRRAEPPPERANSSATARAFWAILRRDLYVTVARAAGLLRAGRAAAAVHALRLREDPDQHRLRPRATSPSCSSPASSR